MNLRLKTSNCEYIFDSSTGVLHSMTMNGTPLLRRGNHAFMLGFRDTANYIVKASSADFFSFECTAASEKSLTFRYSRSFSFPGMSVIVTMKIIGDALTYRARIEGIPAELELEWIEPFDLLLKDAHCELLIPREEGFIPEEPGKQRYYTPDFPYYRHYPGETQMQFLSCWWPEGGLYFAAHDETHCVKSLECLPSDDSLRLVFRAFLGEADGLKTRELTFPFVLQGFKGDWMDACSIYRDWVETDPSMPPKGHFPDFFSDSPVSVLYPVQGHGKDSGPMAPNEYFPYMRALPAIRKFAKEFDSRIMALLMHWEGTAPWAPPYVWPPLGGEAPFREYCDALHADGNLLGVYCSGTAWTQHSSINSYSREEQCANEGLEKHMIRGPHNEIEAFICCGDNAQRIGYDMCIAQEWPRKTLIAEALKIASAGVDYAQFFDQNLGGASHLCWCKDHNHPPRPGCSQVQNMRSFMDELHTALKDSGSKMVLGSECAAAQPYIKYLPFSDLRFMCWTLNSGRSVPAYAFVFHEWVNNFMGNQGGVLLWMDQKDNPDNQLYRLAYAFCAGDMLSVVLGANDEFTWTWGGITWDIQRPEQGPATAFIRTLNSFRRNHLDYLMYGRMLKPLADVLGTPWQLKCHTHTYNMQGILHSSWQAQDGRKALIIVNFLQVEQTVTVTPKPDVEFQEETGLLTMKPLSIQMLTIHNS